MQLNRYAFVTTIIILLLLTKMKNLKKLAFITIAAIGIVSCKNDDDAIGSSENKVDAYIQFENVFGNKEFNLNHDLLSKNNGTLNITTLKYIVTDIKLFGTEGTSDFTVSTQESFHIVDQSCESSAYKYLTNIPNGKYNKVSIRYGVSNEIQNAGTDAQGDMLVAAKAAGLNWNWTLGYRFMTYEGSSSKRKEAFKIHNGSTGAIVSEIAKTSKVNHGGEPHEKETPATRIDNSQVIELDFSEDDVILVSDETSPKIHLKVDVAKILSSKNILDISEGDITTDAHKASEVAQNVATIFSIDHIHPTDKNFELPEAKDCKDTTNPNEGGGHDNEDGHHDKEVSKEKKDEEHSHS